MSASQGSGGFWGADIWSDLNRAVAAEAGLVRVVQKVFPATPMPGALNVPADEVDRNDMRIVEGETKRLVEIFVTFQLTQTQVGNELTERAARKLARLAASTLALAEDFVLLRGEVPAKLRAEVADEDAVQDGLLDDADATPPQETRLTEIQRNPEDFIQKVVKGITTLADHGQPGPYALLLSTDVYGDLFKPRDGLATPADVIAPLVTGGFYTTPALDRSGLLVSLGGEPVSIYVGAEPQVAFTQTDIRGVLHFRVFERVQYVLRDERALLRLKFTEGRSEPMKEQP